MPRGSVTVSEDGSEMAYVALHAGRPRLFLRTIDRDAPALLEGSDGASDPFFSPDGRWVGFFAHGSLKKLGVDGGPPVVLSAARAGGGASWGRDDRTRSCSSVGSEVDGLARLGDRRVERGADA